eukprot:gene10157-2319_t
MPSRNQRKLRSQEGQRAGTETAVATLFVRNLAFSQVGPVQKCFIVTTPQGSSRGFGYVMYALREDAAAALEKLNGQSIDGRSISLQFAKRRGTREVTDKEQIYGDSSQPEINIQPKKEEEVDGSRNDVVITKEEEEDDEEQEFHVNDEIADSSDSDETIDENNVVANVHDVKRKKSLADQGHKKYSPIHQQKIDVKEEENEEECPPILRNGILTSAALPTLENKEEIDDAEPIISSKFNSLNKRTESVVRQKPNEPIDKSALDARRTIILSKLSSKTNKKKLFQKMRKFGQIKKITMVGNNGAEVIFAEGPQVTPKFIRDVVLKLDQHELHGTTISASTKVFKRIVPVATKKQARLIIRNLSFSTSEDDLHRVFSRFGKLQEATIIKDSEGRSKGFAFVTLSNPLLVRKAIKEVNGRKINGYLYLASFSYVSVHKGHGYFYQPNREVAVDFALAKNDYQRIEQEKIEQNLSVNNHAEGQDTATNMNVNSKADIHENLSKEEFDDKLRNRSTDDEDDEDEDDDFDEKETPKGSNEKDYESRDDVDISGTSIISGASDFVDESSRRNEWDTADGKTLFFDNIPLHTKTTRLAKLCKTFGATEYCKILRDQETNESKGRGFVRFLELQSADKCLLDAQSEEGLILSGQRLAVEHAKPRDQVSQSSDADDGLTVFIRNVSADATEEDLRELLSQFGEISYALIVYDKKTELPKGTAFVKFKSKDQADACIAISSNPEAESALLLDGRPLSISKAMPKTTNVPLTKVLHFAGVIPTDHHSYPSLSEADKQKRQHLEAETKAKAKNPNMSISKTRLTFHNLPKTVDEKQLRSVIHEAIGPAKLHQVKIVRSSDRLDAQGKPRSKGFAFVEFKEHENALKALRKLNNNPNVFGKNMRPIVLFAWENALILRARQERLDRQKARRNQLHRAALLNEDKFDINNAENNELSAKKKKGNIKLKAAEQTGGKQQNVKESSTIVSHGEDDVANSKGKISKNKISVKRKNKNITNGDVDSCDSTTVHNKLHAGSQQYPSQVTVKQHKETSLKRRKRHVDPLDIIAAQEPVQESPMKRSKRRHHAQQEELAREQKFDNMLAKYRAKLDKAEEMKKWM